MPGRVAVLPTVYSVTDLFSRGVAMYSRYNQRIEDRSHPLIDGPPPFLGRWPRVYAVVLFYVAFVIAALYVLSIAFSY
jgi:hypothetical protein